MELKLGLRDDIINEAVLYRRLASAQIRGQMQYRGSFWMQIAGNALIYSLEFVAVLIFFLHFETLGSWHAGEIAFLYGLSSVSFGIAHIIGGGFASFSQLIVRGEFDRILTRPVSSFVQVLATDVQMRRLGTVLQGIIAFIVAASLIDIPWTPGRALYIPLTIACAVVVFTALFTLEATLCFWTTQATEVVNAFTYGGATLALYPIHIFDLWMRRLFLFIIPLGLVIYAPALYLIDKPDRLGLPSWSRFVAPIAALLFAALAGAAWRAGVRHYRSTGT
jgi:ABC-2 type transport system permease protein